MEAPRGEVTRWILGAVGKAGDEGITIQELFEKFDIAFSSQTQDKNIIWQGLLTSKHVAFVDEIGVNALRKLALDDILDLGLGRKKIKSLSSIDVDASIPDGDHAPVAVTTIHSSSPIAPDPEVAQINERRGRPRKPVDQLSGRYHNQVYGLQDQNPDEVKRKRGRPKKVAPDATAQPITLREHQELKKQNTRPDSRHDGEDAVFTTDAEMQRQAGLPGIYLDEEVQPRRRGGRRRDLSDNYILRMKSEKLKDKNWLMEHKGSWKTSNAAAISTMNGGQQGSTHKEVSEFEMLGPGISIDGLQQRSSNPVSNAAGPERAPFMPANDEQDQIFGTETVMATAPIAPAPAVAVESMTNRTPPDLLPPVPPNQKRNYTRKVRAPTSSQTIVQVATPVVAEGGDVSASQYGHNSDFELGNFVMKRKADESTAGQPTLKHRKLISGLEDELVASENLTSIQEGPSSTVTVYKSQAQQVPIPLVEEGDFVQYEPLHNNLPVPHPQTPRAYVSPYAFATPAARFSATFPVVAAVPSSSVEPTGIAKSSSPLAVATVRPRQESILDDDPDQPDRSAPIHTEGMLVDSDEETQDIVPRSSATHSSAQLEAGRQKKEGRREHQTDKKAEKERKQLEQRERDEDLITKAADIRLPPDAIGLASIYGGSAGNLIMSANKTTVEFFGMEQFPPQAALFAMPVSKMSGVPVTSTKGSYPMTLIIKRAIGRKTTKHSFQYSVRPEAADSAAYMRSMLVEGDPLKKARAGILNATVKQPKPWICGSCDKSFRNENGLAYHVSKARNPCNPNWVPVIQPDRPGSKKRAGSPKPREKSKRQKRAVSPAEDDEEVSEGSPNPREMRKRRKRAVPSEGIFEDDPDVESEEQGNLSGDTSSSRDSILVWAEKHATSGPVSSSRRATKGAAEAEWEPEDDRPKRNAHQIGKRWYKNTPNEIQLLETLAKEIKDVVSMLKINVNDRPVINLTTITDFQELILKIIHENGGCFPGERSMWLAVVSLWLKSQGPLQDPLQNLPESKHCKRAVDELVDLQKLQRCCFEFASPFGKSKRLPRQILLEPGFNVASPSVEDIKIAFAEEYPQVYVPSEYHLPEKTWSRLQLNARDLAAIARKDKRDDNFNQEIDSDESNFETQDVREGNSDIDDDSDMSMFGGDDSLVPTDDEIPGNSINQSIRRRNRNKPAEEKWKDGVYQRPPRSDNFKAGASNLLRERWVEARARGLRSLNADAVPGTMPKRIRRQHEEETAKRMASARRQVEEKKPTIAWGPQSTFLSDPETGAWDISIIPKQPKAGVGRSWGKPKLPEPVTYMQSSNGAWNQRPFGHGASPIFSRPAKSNAMHTQSGIDYLKRKHSGYRPVVYPPKAKEGPGRGPSISALEMYPDMEVPSWASRDSTGPSKAKPTPSMKGVAGSRRDSSVSTHFADEDEFESANFGGYESECSGENSQSAIGQPDRKRRRAINQNNSDHEVGPQSTLNSDFDPRNPYAPNKNGKRQTKTSMRAARSLDSLVTNNWDDEIDTLRFENPGLRSLPGNFGLEEYPSVDLGTRVDSGYTPEKYALQYVDSQTTFEDCDFGKLLSWKYDGWSVPRAPNFCVSFQKKTSYTMPNLPYHEISDEDADYIAPIADRRRRKLSISEPGPSTARAKHGDEKYLTTRIQIAARNDFEGVEDPNFPSVAFDMTNFANKFTGEELSEWFEPSQLADIFNDNQLAAIFEPSQLINLVRTDHPTIEFMEIDRNQVPAMFGIELSQQVVGPTRSSKLAVTNMGNADEGRFIAACVILRTLLGGLEGQLDMVLLARIIPGYEVNVLMKHWANLQESYPSIIEMVEQDFQSSFPEAYAKGEVPSIDYDNQLNCDWGGIIEWFLANIDVTLDRSSKTMSLPGTRTAMNEMYKLTALDFDVDDQGREQFFNPKTTNNRRTDFLAKSTNSLAVKGPGGSDYKVDDLAIAKSLVRAIALTPDTDWNQDVAATKLHELFIGVIEKATEDLTNEKIIRKINKGRATPGRTYLPTDFFKSKFKRTISEHHFRIALNFKQFLDVQFAEDLNSPVRVSHEANEGTIMCITSLQAAGQIRFDAANVVADKMNGLYAPKTTIICKENMFFDIDLFPTTSYIPNNQNALLGNINSALPPQYSEAGELPAWIGITDRIIPQIWRNVITAVTQTVAQRAGIDILGLMSTFGPSLEEWELKRLMVWGEEVGLFQRLSPRIPGWTVAEGWWLATAVLCEMYQG